MFITKRIQTIKMKLTKENVLMESLRSSLNGNETGKRKRQELIRQEKRIIYARGNLHVNECNVTGKKQQCWKYLSQ